MFPVLADLEHVINELPDSMFVHYIDDQGVVRWMKPSSYLPFPLTVGMTLDDVVLSSSVADHVWHEHSFRIHREENGHFGFPYDVFSFPLFDRLQVFQGVLTFALPVNDSESFQAVQRETEILHWLFAISKNVLLVETLEQLWSQFRDVFLQLFHFKGGILFMHDTRTGNIHLIEQFGSPTILDATLRGIEEEILRDMHGENTRYIPDLDAAIVNRYDFAFDELREILFLFSVKDTPMPPMFHALLDFYHLTGTVVHQRSQLQQLARKDPLTGIWNRRALEEHMESYFSESSALPSVFVLFDLDRFKQLNDESGHPIGDVALQRVASSLQRVLRKGDWCARLGGDEFVFVLHEVTFGDSIEREVVNWVQTSPLHLYGLGMTAGVVELRREVMNFQDAYRLADQRLYRGKVSGRNCIVTEDRCIPLIF
ncbi:sensor domain-containing diguanylate cyclase [Sulfoacidibacillus ferrooxidans]|uniref:GGDEF domain-containing protein n=1 Tax=Sulfoacidibacillus ferrooxidans TaxID=2005001 RepID=A0A9X1VCJ3_9BACL|nr:GGDEF domain-containing protein [Sulfoacidibacillus ferrooxidans]MCI0183547.1 hypothetical protein [Sulfoacidibacillus ferrooxidans]